MTIYIVKSDQMNGALMLICMYRPSWMLVGHMHHIRTAILSGIVNLEEHHHFEAVDMCTS